MTNPNNAIGTNAAYDGRTSVNAFNDDLSAYTAGILSGWACAPDSGMTVSLGGDGNTRDVAIAEDNSGNKTTINNISGSPVNVTLEAAPGSNSRIDVIVAYVDNPPQGVSSVADNPSTCGIINVTGTASASPVAPNDNAIRTAITSDGASGTTAYYVVLAEITVANGTTDLVATDIEQGDKAEISGENITDDTINGSKIDFTTITGSQLSNILSRASAGQSVAMIANTTYTFDFDGFAYFRSSFSNTNGYVRFQIKDANNNLVFEYQQNAGPKADYRHLTPIYPIRKGWKYVGDVAAGDISAVNTIAMLPVVIS